jgi:CubicO group peptidase (beta-lactamase class C family)
VPVYTLATIASQNGNLSLKYLQVVALIPGVLFATQLFATDQAADPVGTFVRAEMQRQHIPGLTLLVSRSGKPIRTEGYGLSNLELNVPAKPESIFGSLGRLRCQRRASSVRRTSFPIDRPDIGYSTAN